MWRPHVKNFGTLLVNNTRINVFYKLKPIFFRILESFFIYLFFTLKCSEQWLFFSNSSHLTRLENKSNFVIVGYSSLVIFNLVLLHILCW